MVYRLWLVYMAVKRQASQIQIDSVLPSQVTSDDKRFLSMFNFLFFILLRRTGVTKLYFSLRFVMHSFAW